MRSTFHLTGTDDAEPLAMGSCETAARYREVPVDYIFRLTRGASNARFNLASRSGFAHRDSQEPSWPTRRQDFHLWQKAQGLRREPID